MEPSHVLLILFLAVAVANVGASLDGRKNVWVIYLTKPLLMPLLILYYLAASTRPNPWIPVALGFGFLGDVFLMLPGEKEKNFLAGLVAFLVNQVLYVVVFLRSAGGLLDHPFGLWLLAVPYVLFGACIYRVLAPGLGKLKEAVILYMIVILLMGVSALFRWTSVDGRSFWPVLAGSLLFMASDSVLAYDRFRRRLRLGDMIVMATYLAAQFSIASGFLA